MKPVPVVASAFYETRELLKLLNTYRGLHIRHFEIIPEMAVHILVVISVRQLTIVPVKPVTAQIIMSGRTDAV